MITLYPPSHSVWLSSLIELYNPNQPRDYRGRWSEGGGAFEAAKAGTATHTAAIEKAREEAKSFGSNWAGRLRKRQANAHIASLKKARNAEFDRLKAAHAAMPMQSKAGQTAKAKALEAYAKPSSERLAALKARSAAFEAKTGKTLGIRPAMQSAHGKKLDAAANNPPMNVHTTTGNRVVMQKPKFFDSDKHAIVEADPAKLAAHIQETQPGHFVGAGGTGESAKPGAYAGIGAHVGASKPLDTPTVTMDKGLAKVTDGRHRLAYLKDQGATSVPVMVNKEGAKEFADKFGSGKERDLFGNEISTKSSELAQSPVTPAIAKTSDSQPELPFGKMQSDYGKKLEAANPSLYNAGIQTKGTEMEATQNNAAIAKKEIPVNGSVKQTSNGKLAVELNHRGQQWNKINANSDATLMISGKPHSFEGFGNPYKTRDGMKTYAYVKPIAAPEDPSTRIVTKHSSIGNVDAYRSAAPQTIDGKMSVITGYSKHMDDQGEYVHTLKVRDATPEEAKVGRIAEIEKQQRAMGAGPDDDRMREQHDAKYNSLENEKRGLQGKPSVEHEKAEKAVAEAAKTPAAVAAAKETLAMPREQREIGDWLPVTNAIYRKSGKSMSIADAKQLSDDQIHALLA